MEVLATSTINEFGGPYMYSVKTIDLTARVWILSLLHTKYVVLGKVLNLSFLIGVLGR